jgi:hypothetical protein
MALKEEVLVVEEAVCAEVDHGQERRRHRRQDHHLQGAVTVGKERR